MNLQNENLRLKNLFPHSTSSMFLHLSCYIIQECECVTPQCFTALKSKTYIYLQGNKRFRRNNIASQRLVRRLDWAEEREYNPRCVLFRGNCCCCLLSADHYSIFPWFVLMNLIVILIINLVIFFFFCGYTIWQQTTT